MEAASFLMNIVLRGGRRSNAKLVLAHSTGRSDRTAFGWDLEQLCRCSW